MLLPEVVAFHFNRNPVSSLLIFSVYRLNINTSKRKRRSCFGVDYIQDVGCQGLDSAACWVRKGSYVCTILLLLYPCTLHIEMSQSMNEVMYLTRRASNLKRNTECQRDTSAVQCRRQHQGPLPPVSYTSSSVSNWINWQASGSCGLGIRWEQTVSLCRRRQPQQT